MNRIKKHGEIFLWAGILLLAGFLSVWGIWAEGYSNEFYAAAVKSMLTSWKNFFFVSFDPGGWVTVDKPPVSLWIQTAFAKVLGFSGFSIILPQCLAAVGTVAVTGHVVKRHFGSAAGLITGLVLALSPIFIVVSKTNNTDSILIFFMALAIWAMMKAADSGKLRFLLLSMVLLGVAYNAKTLEAFLILPALFLTYFFTVNRKWRVRVLHLLLAAAVLAAVSLSWSVIVDLTPASERPYVDNSTNNSELELAFGYNGIQRLFGQSGRSGWRTGSSAKTGQGNFSMSGGFGTQNGNAGTQSGSTSSGTSSSVQAGNAASGSGGSFGRNNGNMPNFDGQSGTFSPEGFSGGNAGGESGMPSGQNSGNGGMTGGQNSGMTGGGNSMFNGGGNASPLRLFNTTLGGQDSWLLPFGLFAIAALLLAMRKTDAEKRRRLLRNVLLWGVSLLTMAAYFSVSSFFHPYYISVMAPVLAALVGIGTVEMWKFYKRSGPLAFLFPAALGVTLAAQIAMLTAYPAYARFLIPMALIFTGMPAVVLTAAKIAGRESLGKIGMNICAAIAVAGLLIAPATWTVSSVATKSFNSQIPSAGPSAESTTGVGMNGGAGSSSRFTSSRNSSSTDSKLASFLVKNNTGEKYLVAVASSSEAEPIILATGKPVISIGGFSGNDNTLTVAKLEKLVRSGQLKYYLVGGRSGNGDSSDSLTSWVKKYGKAVDSNKWSSGSSTGTLYDLSSYKSS